MIARIAADQVDGELAREHLAGVLVIRRKAAKRDLLLTTLERSTRMIVWLAGAAGTVVGAAKATGLF